MDFQSHKYTDRYHHHNYSPLSLALSLLRFTLCSSWNTEMPALTILINPAVIHPEAKQKRIWFSSTPAFHHHIFHSPALAPAILDIFSTLSTSPHLFSLLFILLQCTLSFSPHIHSPLSMFLPLHPSRSSFTLQYHTRSVSPISFRLCLSVSTSPLGSERPMYPHERERWESLKYWWPQARATSGTLCRGYRPGPQSHWVRVAELQWGGQGCQGRWKRGGGKQMRRSDGVCMCVCKNHVISAASWLCHMRLVVCFQVILSFVRGRVCTEWVDSWVWLCPCSSEISLNTTTRLALSCLLVYAPLPHPCPSFLLHTSISLDPRPPPPPPPPPHPQPPPLFSKPFIFSPFSFSAC